jgi:hypothetical protein
MAAAFHGASARAGGANSCQGRVLPDHAQNLIAPETRRALAPPNLCHPRDDTAKIIDVKDE